MKLKLLALACWLFTFPAVQPALAQTGDAEAAAEQAAEAPVTLEGVTTRAVAADGGEGAAP